MSTADKSKKETNASSQIRLITPESSKYETLVSIQNILDSGDILATIFKTTVEGIVVTDSDGTIVLTNPALQKMLGYTEEELIGTHPRRFLAPESDSRVYKEALSNRGFLHGHIAMWQHKNGNVFPTETNINPITDASGEVTAWIGTARDITERKRNEDEIRKSHDFLENIFKTAGDGIVICDDNGCIAKVNTAFEKILGFSEAELIGRHTAELPPQDELHLQIGKEMLVQGFNNGSVKNMETTWVRKDGTLCPIEFNATFLKNDQGDIAGAVCSIRDITHHKEAEKALWENQARYRAVVENAYDAIITVDSSGNITSWNDAAREMYGYEEKEVLGKSIVMLIPKPLRSTHLHGLENFAPGGNAPEIKNQLESYGLRKDGSLFPMDFSLSPWKTIDETYFTCIVRDITERKRIDNELRRHRDQLEEIVADRTVELKKANEQMKREIQERIQAEEELTHTRDFLDNIIESSLDSLVVTDNSGIIKRANRAYCEMHLCSIEEVLGRHASEFGPSVSGTYGTTTGDTVIINVDVMLQDYKNILEELNRSGKFSQHKVFHARKDGKLVPVEENSVLLFNKNHAQIGTLTMIRDITERTRTENQLKNMNEELEQRVQARTQELQVKSTSLEELNAALRVLLQKRDEDKVELEDKVLSNISELVEPSLEKLQNSSLDIHQREWLNIVRSNLKDITSPFTSSLTKYHFKLTPKEIQIANLIKEGKTSKEIADLMHVSIRTIDAHRDNIRKKLHIKNKKENLRTHLLSLLT